MKSGRLKEVVSNAIREEKPLRRPRPRRFTYLDSQETKRMLSEILGGLPDGYSSSARGGNNDSGDWGDRFEGTGVGGTSAEDTSYEDTESFTQTPESRFKRLHEEVSREVGGDSYLTSIESLNREDWDELRKGSLVEIPVVLKIPEEIKAIEAARSLDQLQPLMDMFGEEEDEQTLEAMRGLRSLGESAAAQNSLVVILEVAASPRYKFVAKLNREHLRVELDALEGEATVLGTVGRKVGKDDPPIGLEQIIPGLEGLRDAMPKPSRAQRRAAPKNQQQEEETTTIAYPAAVFDPIGIYNYSF